jgi:hypothetical protein
MTMPLALRKLALTAHVVTSVGWLGAVVAFLALALAGLVSRDAQLVRGAYLAMEVTGWYVLVPLCVAALVTGLVLSLGTPWGLFRHYWVLFKLLITVAAAIILFLYTQTLGYLGDLAADGTVPLEALRNPSPVLHAVAALAALLVATVLATYKPQGLTPYGQRRLHQRRVARSAVDSAT